MESTRIVYQRCPLCGSSDLKTFLHLPDHSISKENFELVQCASCSFLLTQNIPSEDTIGPYYASEDYISHSNTSKGLINRLYHFVRDIMLSRKWRTIRSLTTAKRLLDIGSGTGHFLHFMKNKGYNPLGIEVSDEANKIAVEEFGLQIRSPQQFLNGELSGTFDVITMWHVLEHVHQLDRYMETIRRLLDDRGWLLIAVPNHTSFEAKHYKEYWCAYDVPRHLWHFSPQTMERLANKHQFTIRKLKRLPFDSFYNALLSEKYRGNSLALFAGFFYGSISYINSLFSVRRSSSVVYILQKKET